MVTETLKYNAHQTGMIMNIEHGSVKDGPGWRSVIYFKGCNFRCLWCGAPESIEFGKSLLIYSKHLKFVKTASKVCKHNAISKKDNGFVIDVKKCRKCSSYDCIKFVLDGSMELVGKETDIGKIIEEIIPYKDLINDYGVTISGGEPTCQFPFLIELLRALRYNGFHTAIETNASSPRLLELIKYLNLVICDLKQIDDKKHRKQTGFTNKMVLENIRSIAEKKHPMWIRIPVVPGINDNKNLENTASFLSDINYPELKVELLQYHRMGISKWKALRKRYSLEHVIPPAKKKFSKYANMFAKYGIQVIKT